MLDTPQLQPEPTTPPYPNNIVSITYFVCVRPNFWRALARTISLLFQLCKLWLLHWEKVYRIGLLLLQLRESWKKIGTFFTTTSAAYGTKFSTLQLMLMDNCCRPKQMTSQQSSQSRFWWIDIQLRHECDDSKLFFFTPCDQFFFSVAATATSQERREWTQCNVLHHTHPIWQDHFGRH